MAKKSLVAAVRTTPQTVLDDYARLLDLSKYQEVLDANATTILKNNISSFNARNFEALRTSHADERCCERCPLGW